MEAHHDEVVGGGGEEEDAGAAAFMRRAIRMIHGVEGNNNIQPEAAAIMNAANAATTAIVSGSDTNAWSDHDEEDDDDESDNDENEGSRRGRARRRKHTEEEVDKTKKKEGQQDHDESFYSATMDDEDEAWVYKHMRGGIEELVQVKKNNHQQPRKDPSCVSGKKTTDSHEMDDAEPTTNRPNDEKDDAFEREPDTQWETMLRPRSTDAVLSCPCCFNIVCMDCQRHERFRNQYRAMFVMNIGVHWDRLLRYDEDARELKVCPQPAPAASRVSHSHHQQRTHNEPTPIPSEEDSEMEDNSPKNMGGDNKKKIGLPHEDHPNEEVYYAVYCLQCHTEVAALDMADEIYHFYGCIAS